MRRSTCLRRTRVALHVGRHARLPRSRPLPALARTSAASWFAAMLRRLARF